MLSLTIRIDEETAAEIDAIADFIPAKAGIQKHERCRHSMGWCSWTPAFAGVTGKGSKVPGAL